MQTIILRADEALINQIVAVAHALANTTNQKLETIPTERLKAEIEHAERIKGYQDDYEAIKRGELETYPLESLRDEVEKW